MPAKQPTALQRAEQICARTTSRFRADRVKALHLLIKAGGGPLDRTVLGWVGPDVWYGTFHCNLFRVVGNAVSLSYSVRRMLGWPAPALYVSEAKRLAGVRALVARAKNVAEVPRKEKS